jgi:hypothetical protein
MKRLIFLLSLFFGGSICAPFEDSENQLAEFDFGLKLERSIFSVMDRWVEKNKQIYHLVVAPLVNVLI